MNKIRKGDTVKILSGKDKGRTGTVLRVVQKKDTKSEGPWVIVEGMNIIKKHTRGNPQLQKPGGIIPKEAPIHISNVGFYDADSKKPSRIGFKTLEDGKKVRVLKRSGEVCDA